MNAKKVTVLSGFLGAGKTTLLNAILKEKNKTRFAIIENEVGQIGIDGELIIKNKDSFTELNNGCICCSLNDNFTDTLKELSERDDWDELIIEATGVANPAGIISPFKKYPWLGKYFQSPVVITIADAQNFDEQLKVSEIAASQLAYADKVFINKSDLITGERLREIQSKAQALNPFAYFFSGNKNEIPVWELLEKKDSKRPSLNFGAVMNPTKVAQLHHDGIRAISLEFQEFFNEDKLFVRLYSFLAMHGENVYRIKGIFYDSRKPKKKIVQSVMRLVYVEEGEEWSEDEQKLSRFVFIGKDLDEKVFDLMLKTCLL